MRRKFILSAQIKMCVIFSIKKDKFQPSMLIKVIDKCENMFGFVEGILVKWTNKIIVN